MTDEEQFFKFFSKVRVKPIKYTDRRFLTTSAVRAGADHCWYIPDMDFNFDKAGRLVGINSSSRHSFRGRVKQAASRSSAGKKQTR